MNYKLCNILMSTAFIIRMDGICKFVKYSKLFFIFIHDIFIDIFNI